MLFFGRTCREVTTILVAREDRSLGWSDGLALRIHLSVCKTCPRFERQMLTMRQSFQRWRHYANEENDPNTDATFTKKN
jgi:hypothetical protein